MTASASCNNARSKWVAGKDGSTRERLLLLIYLMPDDAISKHATPTARTANLPEEEEHAGKDQEDKQRDEGRECGHALQAWVGGVGWERNGWERNG